MKRTIIQLLLIGFTLFLLLAFFVQANQTDPPKKDHKFKNSQNKVTPPPPTPPPVIN